MERMQLCLSRVCNPPSLRDSVVSSFYAVWEFENLGLSAFVKHFRLRLCAIPRILLAPMGITGVRRCQKASLLSTTQDCAALTPCNILGSSNQNDLLRYIGDPLGLCVVANASEEEALL
jgi:hypothetical protein